MHNTSWNTIFSKSRVEISWPSTTWRMKNASVWGSPKALTCRLVTKLDWDRIWVVPVLTRAYKVGSALPVLMDKFQAWILLIWGQKIAVMDRRFLICSNVNWDSAYLRAFIPSRTPWALLGERVVAIVMCIRNICHGTLFHFTRQCHAFAGGYRLTYMHPKF